MKQQNILPKIRLKLGQVELRTSSKKINNFEIRFDYDDCVMPVVCDVSI